MMDALQEIMEKLQERIDSAQAKGKTITLKIKYFDFEQHTRSFSYPHYINDRIVIFKRITDLLQNPFPEKAVRLLGITLSNLEQDEKDEYVQLTLDF